jgi:hypothetical protein
MVDVEEVYTVGTAMSESTSMSSSERGRPLYTTGHLPCLMRRDEKESAYCRYLRRKAGNFVHKCERDLARL